MYVLSALDSCSRSPRPFFTFETDFESGSILIKKLQTKQKKYKKAYIEIDLNYTKEKDEMQAKYIKKILSKE